MAVFQIYLQSEKEKKMGWVLDDSHVVLVKFPGGKGSARWLVVLMQWPVLLSPKFGAKSSHGEGSAHVGPMETFGCKYNVS
jgi:hypothetical protein